MSQSGAGWSASVSKLFFIVELLQMQRILTEKILLHQFYSCLPHLADPSQLWRGIIPPKSIRLNLRPGGGVGGGGAAPPFFGYLFIHQFRTLRENFGPRSSQVRLPGQVKWQYLHNLYDYAVTAVFKVLIWNFQELIRASVHTKRLSRNVHFGDLKSGQFWDLTIIRQWENA